MAHVVACYVLLAKWRMLFVTCYLLSGECCCLLRATCKVANVVACYVLLVKWRMLLHVTCYLLSGECCLLRATW